MAAAQPTRQPRTAGEVARGLGALLLILALLAGIPAALLTLAGAPPLPSAIPGLSDMVEAITRPDDGTLLLAALVWAGWIGWASFAISVAVEVPAALRGVRAPRLPALGPQQRIAAGLVAAIAMLFTSGATSLAADSVAAAAAAPGGIEAADPDATVEADADKPSPRVHIVERGDTLWDLAATNLGNGYRYPDLYEASKDTVQPDGRRLTDPNLIDVGWQITIPSGDDTTPDLDTNGGPAESDEPVSTPPSEGHDVAGDAFAPTPEPAITTEATSAPEPDTTSAEAAPDDAPVPNAAGSTSAAIDDPDDDDSFGICTAGGVGAVLAGGLLLYVGTLRARQHRHRPPGHRIALPTGDAARTEDELRRIHDPVTLDHVNRALRTLAARCAVTGGPLPALRFARLIGGQLELNLAEPAEPPAPFLPTASPTLWVLDTDGDILDSAQAEDYPAPYPTLVTVGHDPDGGLILVDLEHAGVFAIDGSDTATGEILAAMAAELATSTWSSDVHVTVVGAADDIASQLDRGRISHVDGSEAAIDDVLDQLSTRVAADRDALAADGAAGVGDARTSGIAEGTWAPEVVLIGTPMSDAQRDRLADLVMTEPRVAAAAVAVQTSPVTEWATHLNQDDPENAVLDPLGLAVIPQRITAQQRDHLVDLLASGHADTVPASASWHVDVHTASPVTDIDAASLVDEPTNVTAQDTTPLVAVLGQVEVQHTPDLAEPNKRGQLTALAAYLAMNPGRTRDAVDEAMWPGRRVSLATRNTAMTKLRNWLGTDPDGNDYVPRASGDGYRLRPEIRTDWHLFCDLVPNGPATAPTAELRAALSLVRDQPFKGANPRRYVWAERIQQEMIAAVGDVADELARRALLAGDTRLALAAVAAGLAAEPVSEVLWRHRLRALHAVGDRAALERAADQITALADDLGGELEDETVNLISDLLDTPRPAMSRRTA